LRSPGQVIEAGEQPGSGSDQRADDALRIRRLTRQDISPNNDSPDITEPTERIDHRDVAISSLT